MQKITRSPRVRYLARWALAIYEATPLTAEKSEEARAWRRVWENDFISSEKEHLLPM